MAKRSRAKPKNEGQAFPVTSARLPVDPGPAQAVPLSGGQTTGYRDGEDCVERKIFYDGVLGKGWKDTPANLKHNYREKMVLIK
jgi:hypothetical protein